MNKKRLLIAMGLVFILCITLFQAAQETANAEEKASEACMIVRIQGKDLYSGMRIEPEKLTVERGTCVIWTNWSRGTEVKIEFADAKQCKDATEAPMGFTVNEQRNCYNTTFLRMGETSSLRFMQKGAYNYTVVTNTGLKVSGQIYVLP